MSMDPRVRAVFGQIRVGIGGLRRSGFLRSLLTGRPVDGSRRPIPWLTYSAIHQLQKTLRPDDRVVEIGSGNSTLWFAERVAEVRSIETDSEWAQRVNEMLAAAGRENAKVVYAPNFDERLTREMMEKASVISIDGGFRCEAAAVAAAHAPHARLIIIDNTDCVEWASIPQLFERRAAVISAHRSMGPCLLHEWETTLVYMPAAPAGTQPPPTDPKV